MNLTPTQKYILLLLSLMVKGDSELYRSGDILNKENIEKHIPAIKSVNEKRGIKDLNTLTEVMKRLKRSKKEEMFKGLKRLVLEDEDRNNRGQVIDSQIDDPTQYIYLSYTHTYGERLPAHMRAYDETFQILIMFQSYCQSIISKDDFFRMSLPHAQAIQQVYDSWEDYFLAFYIGYMVEFNKDPKEDHSRDLRYARDLIGKVNSPLYELAWKTPLVFMY